MRNEEVSAEDVITLIKSVKLTFGRHGNKRVTIRLDSGEYELILLGW